jgi:hypothetical protein
MPYGGMPARKAPHFKGSKQRGQFGQQVMDFPLALTPELAECLRDVCREFLAADVSMNRLAGIRRYTSWTKSPYSQESSMELTSEDFISSPAGCGVPSRHRDRSGFPIEGPMMSEKSPRKSMSKKSGKSLKEKRADKKAKSGEHTVIETAFHAKKR